jgi:hypothetical protein
MNHRSCWRIAKRCAASVALAACALASTSPARADDATYCRKVQARAAGDAALLFAPSLQVQGIRFPASGTVDAGVTTGSGYQLRASVSWSPLDAYKGTRVLRVGEADCARQQAIEAAQELLEHGLDLARYPAAKRQRDLLHARRPSWEAIAASTDRRLEANVTTVVEADDVRVRIAALELATAQTDGEVERIESTGIERYRGTLGNLAKTLDSTSMHYEREASHVRTIEPWDVRLTGGYVPEAFGATSDFFGVIQVSYNVGGIWRNGAESRYLDARAEELKKSRSELQDRLRVFRARVKVAAAQTKRELATTEARFAALTAVRKSIEASEAAAGPHQLAIIDLELVAADSNRTFLGTYLEELSRMEEN